MWLRCTTSLCVTVTLLIMISMLNYCYLRPLHGETNFSRNRKAAIDQSVLVEDTAKSVFNRYDYPIVYFHDVCGIPEIDTIYLTADKCHENCGKNYGKISKFNKAHHIIIPKITQKDVRRE